MKFCGKVLVVGVDPGVCRAILHVLRKDRFEVLTAADGEQGLAMARTHKPALVILDVATPGKDGYEVGTELQKDPATKDILILMLTARSKPEEMIRGLRSSADVCVKKPLDIEELRSRSRRLILRCGKQPQ